MNPTIGARRVGRAALLLAALSVLAVLIAPRPAFAFDVVGFEAGAFNADQSLARQAGARPFELRNDIQFATRPGPSSEVPDGDVKNVVVDLPAGFVGNPAAAPRCAQAQFTDTRCPDDSQVGTILLQTTPNPQFSLTLPVFNLVPAAGQPAQFGFNFFGILVFLDASVRTGTDYGITITVKDIPQTVPVYGTKLVFWGVPAAPEHDAMRGHFLMCQGDPPSECYEGDHPATIPPKPFLSNPTRCDAPLVTRVRADSWQNPGHYETATYESNVDGTPTALNGCDKLVFEPTLTTQPLTAAAGAPSGFAVRLAVPQSENPSGLATPTLKKAVVRLPEGVSVSASSADGLTACTPAQIGLDRDTSPTCPESAKIGSVTIDTPLLEKPLTGGVYLAQQTPSQLLRIYAVAEGSGVVIKLSGKVDPDPQTGQLTTTFDDNPQMPFTALELTFKGGPRAPLAMPEDCGVKTTTSELTPHSSGTAATPGDSFTISQDGRGGACAGRGFAPGFEAGTLLPAAGKSSAFSLTFSRKDGEQDLQGLTVALPPGLLGRIARVPAECSDAAAAAAACDEGSRIGSVTTDAGAGPNPFQLPGSVYLTGPYKGAPYGLAIAVPAVAGPLDLGVVVVRAAIFIDPITAQVTVISDPLPTIRAGIPLRLRAVNVRIDRDGFMVNPTNCTATQVAARITSAQGTAVPAASRFQVGDCAALGLDPALALTLSGKGQTTDGKHPAVTAKLTQPAGQANLKRVRVQLPLTLALDPDNATSDDMCGFAEGSKTEPVCPKSSIVGTATATTPILRQPLSGPVYFVKNQRTDPKSKRQIATTPKLVIPLVGEHGVKLVLTGVSTVVDDHLVATFDNIPDAAVTSFQLNLNGGKKGILVVSGDKADICKTTQIAKRQISGQNGKVADRDISIQTPSCPTRILSTAIGKTTVKLKVGGLGAGKVTVTGRGIRKTTRTIARSTVATITAKRSGKAKPGNFKVKFVRAKAAVTR